MFNIEQYLKKFSSQIQDTFLHKEKVSMAIAEMVGIEISKKEIEIKHNVVLLRTRPIIKNEILLKKKAILEKLQEFGITDIR